MVRQPDAGRAVEEWTVEDPDGRVVGTVQLVRRGVVDLGYQAAQNPKQFAHRRWSTKGHATPELAFAVLVAHLEQQPTE